MSFLHLADLHFGKMLHGVSLLEKGDQGDWVGKLLTLIDETLPDAVVIAGDVYDRSTPSGAAMDLLSRMVTAISDRDIPVLIAAGNHDSGQRLACFKDILAYRNVHISGVLQRELTHVELEDAHGPVTFWLLPYTFPAAAAQVLGDDSIRDYEDAVRRILAEQPIDFSRRNVLIAHQNVVQGGKDVPRGGSESVIGGVGQVEYTVFDGFDYVALGHIHASYAVGRSTVRYAGSPLCYHFNELHQPKKGPLLIELGEKGTEASVETLLIPPLHPLHELRRTYEEVMNEAMHAGSGEYVRLVLTDRPVTPESSAFFESLFTKRGSVLMERISEFQRFQDGADSPALHELEDKRIEDLFAAFYAERAGSDPDAADVALMHHAAELLRNSEAGPDGRFVDPALTEQLLAYLEKEDVRS